MKISFNPVYNRINNNSNKARRADFIGGASNPAYIFPSENERVLPSHEKLGLLTFTGFKCPPGEFDIKKIEGLPCPCCGEPMVTNDQAEVFCNNLENKKGAKLQEALQKGYNLYRDPEKEIVDIIIKDSKENPDLDLWGIVAQNAVKSLSSLERVQISILDEMLEDAKELPEERFFEVVRALNETTSEIKNSNDLVYFQRKVFIEKVKKLREVNSDEHAEIYDRLNHTAEKMPTSKTSKDAFFVKYSRRSNRDIAKRLISGALSTTEHLKPQDPRIGGKDRSDNYIPLCSKCNGQRGNMSYNEWFEEHPEMPQNLQKFLCQVAWALERGAVERGELYDTYIDEVIETIKNETGGKLVLKKPERSEYIKIDPKGIFKYEPVQPEQKSEEEIEAEKEKERLATVKYLDARVQLRKYEGRRVECEGQLKKLRKRRKILKNQIKCANRAQKALNIESLEDDYRSCKKEIDRMETRLRELTENCKKTRQRVDSIRANIKSMSDDSLLELEVSRSSTFKP